MQSRAELKIWKNAQPSEKFNIRKNIPTKIRFPETKSLCPTMNFEHLLWQKSYSWHWIRVHSGLSNGSPYHHIRNMQISPYQICRSHHIRNMRISIKHFTTRFSAAALLSRPIWIRKAEIYGQWAVMYFRTDSMLIAFDQQKDVDSHMGPDLTLLSHLPLRVYFLTLIAWPKNKYWIWLHEGLRGKRKVLTWERWLF